MLSVADAEADEAAGNIDFVVNLDEQASGEVTVDYATADDTAVAGEDYQAANGALTFSPGDTSKTVSVVLLDDRQYGLAETFSLTLSNVTGADLDDETAVGTIRNDDRKPLMKLVGLTTTEPDDLEYVASLSSAAEATVSVRWETVTSRLATLVGPEFYVKATHQVDYRYGSGTLTFAPGETEKTITVTVYDDTVDEPLEAVIVELRNIVNAGWVNRRSSEPCSWNACGNGTQGGDVCLDCAVIRDDDLVELAIRDASATEGDSEMALTVELESRTYEDVSVSYATTDGTALAGEDYQSAAGSLTIPAGQKGREINVALVDDDNPEPDEAFTVTLSSLEGATLGDAEGIGTITDDDVPGVSVSGGTGTEGGALDFVVRLAPSSAKTATVSYATSDGTATAGEDYEAVTGTVSFPPGETTRTITVPLLEDELDEAEETFTVRLSNAIEAVIDAATADGTILDNDSTSTEITLTASPTRVSEDNGATDIEVTATLDGGARAEATEVTVSVAGSGDAGAVDFAEVENFTITISEGEKSDTGTFALNPEDDNLDESDETVMIGGSSDLPVTGATIKLVDDDEPSSQVLLSASPARISEDAGPMDVEVTATLDASARSVPTTISVSVTDSGQSDAVDYMASATSFDMAIAAGAITGTRTFTVTPENDEVDERDEVLDITGTSELLVTPTSVTLADSEQTSTKILLSAVPSTVSEGAGETPVEVTAALDAGARTVATTVTVEVMGTGNLDAVDFTSDRHFVIPIAAGATSGRGTFNLVPEDDSLKESSETLTLAGSADLPVTDTSVTITDNDVASDGILLSASPSVVSEGGGAAPVRVTASLNGSARTTGTTITVSVSGSGAPRAVDFQPVQDFTITIPANAASAQGTFTLVPEDDATAEADETLTVSGASDLPVTSTAIALADDDEASSRILLSARPDRVSEDGGSTRVTVTAALDRASRQQETTVRVAVSGSGDPDTVDFQSVQDFEISIPANAGSGAGTFTLTPEDDDAVESDETVTVSGISNLPVTSSAVTLADDDEASTRILLFLSVDPVRASEGDGQVRVTVTAAVDKGVRQEDTRIRVAVAGSGDPDAVDFAPVPGFDIVIPASAPNGTATFTVVPEDDQIDESDETITVSGTSDLPVTPATMPLLDDDEASDMILLSVVPTQVPENAGPVAVRVTAFLDRGLRQEATTVTVSVSGSGDPDSVDFAPVPDFDITIEANASTATGTFTLTPEDDAEDEADETLTLTGASDLPVAATSLVLLDDDETPVRVLSVADAEASEGEGGVAFEVMLDGPSATEVMVSYGTAKPVGSEVPAAEAGVDYNSASGTLTFAPGEVSQAIRVSVVDDDLDETDETFALVLTDPQGATFSRASALGTIRDDDEPPALSVADAAGDENAGALEFEVTLRAPSGIEVTAAYATADGSAAAGSDYEAAQGTLSFAPGEVSKTIPVAILDDAVHEADEETFELSISALVNATPEDVSGTGTIRDDDLSPPSIAGQFPAALLCVGGAPLVLHLSDYFGGDELGFSAVSSTPHVATAALAGSQLTVAPVSEGESTVSVTTTNDAGSVRSSIVVRVVTDPAELEAVDSVLASIGRGVLTSVTESVRARFDAGGGSEAQDASVSVRRDEPLALRDSGAVSGNVWPMRGDRAGAWDGSERPESHVAGADWFEETHRPYRREMAPFSFSLDSGEPGSTDPGWAVWGRGDIQRFESGVDGSSHDGTLAAVHLGADARMGDWLAGLSVTRSAAEADYRFERSVDACGGGDAGEGMIDADLTSVHPYVGRRVGRGQVWAALGAGGGDVSLERCDTGQRRGTDLSMRLAALGGRHPFAGGERRAVSVVEEISVLDLMTGDASGPIGDRSVRVGQARFGLEASGVAPADCDCSLATFVRAFARGDWGDGATGTGLELVAGVRYRNHPRRLGIDAGARALALHSAENAREQSAHITFSVLPKADGTGWQASVAWRRGLRDARLDTLSGMAPPWTAPPESLTGAHDRWIADTRLGYGIALPRGSATPFAELHSGYSQRGRARFGVRHEFGDRVRGLKFEWGIEPGSDESRGGRMLLRAVGRF